MEGEIGGAEGMSEPKFRKGATVIWGRGLDPFEVTIIDGPFRGMEVPGPDGSWHSWSRASEYAYLCKPTGLPALLLAEIVLSSHWQPCPGEHRVNHSADVARGEPVWERRE